MDVARPSRLSALNAAGRVLQKSGASMTCPEMSTAMAEKGYWISPGGKTPSATLYSADSNERRGGGLPTRRDSLRHLHAQIDRA